MNTSPIKRSKKRPATLVTVAAALMLLLLVAPSAEAGHTFPDGNGVHVLDYKSFILTHTSDTGQVPSMNVEVDEPHTWERVSGESILEVRATYTVQAGALTNPTASFRVVWNGTAVDNCHWRIDGGTADGGRQGFHISAFCQLADFVEAGNYTIEVERTALTGMPVIQSITSITLHQKESVSMNIDVQTAFDPYLVGLIWLLLTVFFLTRAAWFPATITFMMMGNFFLDPPVFGLPFAFILTLLAVFLHWMAVNGVFPGRKDAGGEQ